MRWFKRLVGIGLLAGIVALIVLGMQPQPATVDVVEVLRGPLQVTINDDGQTRIREKYVISAPLAGQLLRIDLDIGDEVVAGETVIARMEPTDPSLLDPRAVAQAQLRVEAAARRVEQAQHNLNQAEIALEYARTEMERYMNLAMEGGATDVKRAEWQLLYHSRTEERQAAQSALEIARFEHELEQAALVRTQATDEGTENSQDFVIHAPISGHVLRLMQESTAVLQPGAPIIEIGDPRELEVVVDVLSSDAVGIPPGAEVRIEQWGGDAPLQGRVRLVEPAGFTKFSALGVEEQRVNVVIDLMSPVSERWNFGDGYRVEAAIVVWEEQDCLKIPSSALFRDGEAWVVFVVEDGVARTRKVGVGQSNGLESQITSGLEPGETVIIHPSDQVADGRRIIVRGE